MRQYTTPEQTTKLIELGFKRPKMAPPVPKWVDGKPTFEPQYTIGELIEMLPRTIKVYYDLSIFCTTQGWWVLYGMIGDSGMWNVEYELYRKELIDALYDMVVKRKEEGMI
jgi:hypothetical protein